MNSNGFVELILLGKPQPKQSVRGTKSGIYFKPHRVKEYEDKHLPTVLENAPENPLEGPIRAEYSFYFQIPKSAKRKTLPDKIIENDWKEGKPDFDNLVKMMNDLMERAKYFNNDSQVCMGSFQKCYSDTPRVEVRLFQIVWV